MWDLGLFTEMKYNIKEEYIFISVLLPVHIVFL